MPTHKFSLAVTIYADVEPGAVAQADGQIKAAVTKAIQESILFWLPRSPSGGLKRSVSPTGLIVEVVGTSPVERKPDA